MHKKEPIIVFNRKTKRYSIHHSQNEAFAANSVPRSTGQQYIDKGVPINGCVFYRVPSKIK